MSSKAKLVVDCDRCDYEETTRNYDRAEELYDQHHIPTGHRPAIDERGSLGRKNFKVVCDTHGIIGRSDHHGHAESIKDSHHIVTGCRPVIEEQ